MIGLLVQTSGLFLFCGMECFFSCVDLLDNVILCYAAHTINFRGIDVLFDRRLQLPCAPWSVVTAVSQIVRCFVLRWLCGAPDYGATSLLFSASFWLRLSEMIEATLAFWTQSCQFSRPCSFAERHRRMGVET